MKASLIIIIIIIIIIVMIVNFTARRQRVFSLPLAPPSGTHAQRPRSAGGGGVRGGPAADQPLLGIVS